MSRERTDADEFSIAMFGSIVVALVLTFVIAGFVTHWEQKEASANLKGDPSRVSAVIESARVSYWSKDRLEGLKVQFDGEVYTPKITPVARNYSVVHQGHGNTVTRELEFTGSRTESLGLGLFLGQVTDGISVRVARLGQAGF